MPKITFLPHEELCPKGLEIDVEEGITICDVAFRIISTLSMRVRNHVLVRHVMFILEVALNL